ncbi:MAG: DUF255 domain-containing protein [Chlorobi bacterium]|nr:DUF255 domain-containing protein [Chlorobiota bacterium]
MKKIIRFFIVTNILFSIAFTINAQVLKPVKWQFSTEKINKNEYNLIFKATIDNKWHLYSQDVPPGGPIPTSFTINNSDKFEKIGEVEEYPTPIEEFDPTFEMVIKYFANEATFKQKIKTKTDKPYVINGVLEFMCCDDERCLPPEEVDFSFNINTSETEEIVQKTSINEEKNKEIIAGNESKDKKSLWLFFFISFLAGLAAILTPCVFPMIPMTVTFFMHNSENKVKAKTQALFYGFSIILIYTIIGTVVALTLGANFANWLSTHWLPNIFFFLVFLIFAASFLGMFEITLPSWLINRTDKQADKGGYSGSFFMAFTLVLVSFSCTGPIVGAILVESAGGLVMKPIIGMFGFSLAFALPFTLFAFFPSWLSGLPKSGGWLNSVKVVLGFVELALGLKFLSIADQTYHWGILDREIYLAFWIIIFALLGFYLLGKLRFAHDSKIETISVPRLMMAIVTFTFVIYLIPGMIGAPLKALSGYLPPQTTHDFDLHAIIRENAGRYVTNEKKNICEKPKYSEFLHLPHGLEGYFDYDQALACAKEQNKPIFIDFTGHGCVNCREMEAKVWSDPKVLKILNNEFVIVALYVDDKTKLDKSEWITSSYDGKVKKTIGKKYSDFQISRFNVNAQPYYVLMDTEGKVLTSPKAYNLNVDDFIEFLNKGIEEFKNRNN